MMRPAISAVVPLYNKAAYVVRCLESIQGQSWRDFEAIVVDDGSSDGSGDLARSFADPRFRLVRQENRGEGAARNRGVAEARAPLVAFLDADDEWAPGFLEAILELARRYPQAGLLATGYRRRMPYGADREVSVRCDGPGRLIRDYFERVCEGDPISASSAAAPKAVLEEVGGFLVGERIGADREMWARIALRHPIAFDRRILAVYHCEADGRSFDQTGARLPFPPVVRTLRRARDGALPPHVSRGALEAYIDWQLMKNVHSALAAGNRADMLAALMAERFHTARYRLEKGALGIGCRMVPMRALRALRFKPAHWMAALRRCGFELPWRSRRMVVVRNAAQAVPLGSR